MYGRSRASKLVDEGRFEEAIEEATRAAAGDPDDPEPLVDRAHARIGLDHHAEAVRDLEAALRLDEAAAVLDTPLVDDAYFSALLGWARQADGEEGVARIARYRDVMPSGAHLADVETWTRRLRGEVRGEFVKRRLDDPDPPR